MSERSTTGISGRETTPADKVVKLSPQPGDVVVLKGIKLSPEEVQALHDKLGQFDGVMVIYSPDADMSLALLDEDAMRQNGWVRAVPTTNHARAT